MDSTELAKESYRFRHAGVVPFRFEKLPNGKGMMAVYLDPHAGETKSESSDGPKESGRQ